jgi:hypothetical protein
VKENVHAGRAESKASHVHPLPGGTNGAVVRPAPVDAIPLKQKKLCRASDHLNLLRLWLENFDPRQGRKGERLDWFHAVCLDCGMHWPLWHHETHLDPAPTCPCCESKNWTQRAPNHPNLKIWIDHIQGFNPVAEEIRLEARKQKQRREAAEVSSKVTDVSGAED